MSDSPRMSAYDTDRTHFEKSESGSQRHSLDGGSHQKADDATNAADRDLEKSTPQPHSTTTADEDASASPVPPPIGSDAPDGGYRAWLVIFGAWCSSFCTWGWINAVGVFQEYYQSTLLKEYSSSTVSWIPSLQIFFMMGMGPIMGVLYDKYGPRKIILVGSFLHVFGLMMASISTEYYQILLSQGVCSAIGVAAIFQPALTVIPGWFNKNRGTAYGVLATGSSIGGVCLPIMVNRLIRSIGFGWAMRITAFIIFGLLIIVNLTVKAYRIPPPRKVTFDQFWRPFTEFRYLMVSIGMAIFTWGMYVPMNYLQVDAVAGGMDPNLVQYLVAIFGAGSLFGRLLSGVFGDLLGIFNVFIVVCYIASALILALWIPAANDACRIAFAVLYGFFSGAYVSQLPALVATVSPLRDMGIRTGMVFFCTSIPALTSNPIAGAILGDNNNWHAAKAFAGVMCAAGTCFIVMTRMSLAKSKGLFAKV